LVSSAGMVAAFFVDRWFHSTAYIYMLGAAFFGGIFVWLMIFITHLAFRRRAAGWPQPPFRVAPRGPWTTLFGLTALTAVLISTWWVPGLRITLTSGLPWLAFISLCYLVWRQAQAGKPSNGVTRHG
jgi:AAT family amino acid transporter